MRILIYSQVPPPTHGSTIATLRLIEVLRGQGHEVRILDRRFSRSVEEVGSGSLRKVVRLFDLWRRAIVELSRRPDVLVFFGTNRLGSFLVDCTVSALAGITRTRTIQYLHTVGFVRLAERSGLLRWLVQRFLQQANVIVCLAQSIVADVVDFVSPELVTVIPNAIEPLPALPSDSGSGFVFLANLIPEKGAMDVVELAARFEHSHPSCTFDIYGHPADVEYLTEVQRRVSGLSNATYRGPILDVATKARALSEAIALLYPSRYPFEAQPLAIIEAMSVGTPTVAYGVGAIPDLVRPGEGVVVDSIDEMSLELEALLADSDRRARLSLGAMAGFKARHSMDDFSRSWAVTVQGGGTDV